jgi:solute carrier family 24 (sodium/potassium/calcium exchanger), member 6
LFSFCPNLRVIASSMGLSQNIAGVTFLAFGNGSPDVFSAIAAIGNAKDGNAGLAFGALFGAGVFISTVIVGIICIIKPFTSIQRPILRDIIFFLAASFFTFAIIWDGKIYLYETLGFLGMYVVYVIVIGVGRYWNQNNKLKRLRALDPDAVISNDFGAKSQRSNKKRKNSEDVDERSSLLRNTIENNVNYNSNDINTTSDDIEQQQNEDSDNDDDNNEEEEEERARRMNDDTNSEILVEFTTSSALFDTFIPVDISEWRESNIFNKIIIIIKVLKSKREP